LNYRLSRHAREEMERRNIPAEIVESVLQDPQQVIEGPGEKRVYQSRVEFQDGKTFLVRVFVAEEGDIPVVITVYRTRKIEKYWRKI
jgi:hypothetical protein